MTLHSWQRRLSLILTGVFFVTGASVRAVEAADGSIVVALVRPGSSPHDNDGGEQLPSGTVLIENRKGTQRFVVDTRNLSGKADLGVFIGTAPDPTNGLVLAVNVLHNADALTGRWTLTLDSKTGAPAQLGVVDVNDLAGRYVYIADSATNVFLRGFVPALVPRINALNFNRNVRMDVVNPGASAKARGTIRARHQARRGASTLETRVRQLSAGNTYCFYIVAFPDQPAELCAGSLPLIDGRGFLRHETGRGEDLPFGVAGGVTSVQQLSGLYIEVRDVFGVTHLRGVIP